jgi:YfiH family protein
MIIHGIRHGFTLKEKLGVKYLTIPSFEDAGGVLCAFSTRIGGVSDRPYDTLNFSKKREGSLQNFIENLKRFGNAVGFNHEDTVAINYAHSAELYKAELSDAGCGILKKNVPVICDGLYTDKIHLPLMSFHADCLPLFFYDRKQKIIVICHAGWRGITRHITKNSIKSLLSLGSAVQDILAAVGPCICGRHYEVGQDLSEIFISEFGEEIISTMDGRIYANLASAVVLDMTGSGIRPENLTLSDMCTFEDSQLFFSHRRENGKTGAMAAVIEITD